MDKWLINRWYFLKKCFTLRIKVECNFLYIYTMQIIFFATNSKSEIMQSNEEIEKNCLFSFFLLSKCFSSSSMHRHLTFFFFPVIRCFVFTSKYPPTLYYSYLFLYCVNKWWCIWEKKCIIYKSTFSSLEFPRVKSDLIFLGFYHLNRVIFFYIHM